MLLQGKVVPGYILNVEIKRDFSHLSVGPWLLQIHNGKDKAPSRPGAQSTDKEPCIQEDK